MATIITERNLEALQPLFKSWEKPDKHRRPGGEGEGAKIEPGRRPSQCHLVRGIRSDVDDWRKSGYSGVSVTSKYLLDYWFNTEHIIKSEDGQETVFCYYWAQREAIETIIYLYEMREIRNVGGLLKEFGNGLYDDIADGILPEKDRWSRNCCKIATGGGKTKVMSLAIVWSYFNRIYEENEDMAKNFLLIAPNLTVYERLKDDFENCKIFFNDPLVPDEWKSDFQVQVILQDEAGGSARRGTIYLTNIHRLYDQRNRENEEEYTILGPKVNRDKALETLAYLRERLSNNESLMVLNDEAHHLHDDENAWNSVLESMNKELKEKGNKGILLQLDFTATPKHNNGDLFRHIICDFPLGEAVDAGIVKVPVMGESKRLNQFIDISAPVEQKYRLHLDIGYNRYEESYNQWNKVSKPILFVMTENTKAADEIAKYLDSDKYPLLKGRVLNLHTNLTGKVKTVIRGGKTYKEFITNEKNLKDDDLKALREMSRNLDSKDSKYRCIVSVLMLREGWDIRNVTTIIPLRAYSAKSGILPEQTLGRGLRLMSPGSEIPETVTVIEHEAFRKLYEQELELEGVDICVIQDEDRLRQTVSIFVDRENKDVDKYEIEIPHISESVDNLKKIEEIDYAEILALARDYGKLPLGEKKDIKIEYTGRLLFTNEIIEKLELDMGLMKNAWSALQLYSRQIAQECNIIGYQNILNPLLSKFISEDLFERKVDIYSGEIDHRMMDEDVQNYIFGIFTTILQEKTIIEKKREISKSYRKISDWKPYQVTKSDTKPVIKCLRTMFNLVPCDRNTEKEFAINCDHYEDVTAFAKNAGPQKIYIDYIKSNNHRGIYVPDFMVKVNDGTIYLCELKGRVDLDVPLKARSAVEWCKTASKGENQWEYLYIPYNILQKSRANSIEELFRECKPSLVALLSEKEKAQITIDFDKLEDENQKEALEEKILDLCKLEIIPQELKASVMQASQLLVYAEETNMDEFSFAFQPLLLPLEKYSLKIIVKQLNDKIPKQPEDINDYFYPSYSTISSGLGNKLNRKGKLLMDNLIYARFMNRIGLLIFLLHYALELRERLGGIWKDVISEFSSREMRDLYNLLQDVYDFRNTRIVHAEEKLKDIKKAWEYMPKWINLLVRMHKMIGNTKNM